MVYVSQTYHSGCMLERNRYMAEHSLILMAVYNGSWRSGTGAAVRYAKRLGRTVYVFNPISRTIAKEPAEKRAPETDYPESV